MVLFYLYFLFRLIVILNTNKNVSYIINDVSQWSIFTTVRIFCLTLDFFLNGYPHLKFSIFKADILDDDRIFLYLENSIASGMTQ